MRISLSQAKHIVKRSHEKYNSDVLPELLKITEFDNPQFLINEHFEYWLYFMDKKEKLVDIAFDIELLISRSINKQKIDQLYIGLEKINYLLKIVEQLREYPETRNKNEILGTLTKLSKESGNISIETSIFNKETKDEFNVQYDKLLVSKQQIIDEIESKHLKTNIELPEDMVDVLKEENMI